MQLMALDLGSGRERHIRNICYGTVFLHCVASSKFWGIAKWDSMYGSESWKTKQTRSIPTRVHRVTNGRKGLVVMGIVTEQALLFYQVRVLVSFHHRWWWWW